MPLWNPYIFTGQPLVANSLSSLFYAPNLMLRVLSPGNVATFRIFFNILFAGVFTFLFCRELKISDLGATFSALAFTFSGPMVVWAGFPLANVLVCLPFLMWVGEKMLGQNNLSLTLLLGCGLGLSLLGGHPQSAFHIIVTFSLYFLARSFFLERDRTYKIGLLASFALACIIGVLVSAIQLLPFLDFMFHSSTFAHGGRGAVADGPILFYSEDWIANLSTIITFISPDFFGHPLNHNYRWPFTNYQNYNEQTVYFGLIPLMFACSAALTFPRQRSFGVIAVLALFCIGVAWSLPLFEAVNHLPIFSLAAGKRLKLPFVFYSAVLAGFGFDLFFRRLKQQGRSFHAGVLIPLAVITLFASISIVKHLLPQSGASWSVADIQLASFSAVPWKIYLPLSIAAAAIAGYCWARRSATIARRLPGILILLTIIELLAYAWGYNTTMREIDILPPSPAVQFLQAREIQPYRILATDQSCYPNYLAAYGIADVAGYDVPVYDRFSDLYLAQGGENFGEQIDSWQQWDPNWPLVDFLNVKYVISPRDLRPDKYRPVYSAPYFRIYENLHVLPRAFMVFDSVVISDRAEILDQMLQGKIDFRKKVILEEEYRVPEVISSSASAKYSITYPQYRPDDVVLEVTSDKPGILVMSDLYTPDWTVQVDATPAKLYRANYTYRAVMVPSGKHTISFHYAPVSYTIGAVLTSVSLALVCITLLILLRRRKSQ